MAVQRSDGSWLLDGMLSIDEFDDLFEPIRLPEGTMRHWLGSSSPRWAESRRLRTASSGVS